jgi:hypothetical protein
VPGHPRSDRRSISAIAMSRHLRVALPWRPSSVPRGVGIALKSSRSKENGMAWYWPDLDSPQSAKTAVVNAVGVSAVFAIWLFLTALPTLVQPSRRTGRPWLSLIIAVVLALIGWGIRRMSRVAAIAGVVLWLAWAGFRIPMLISIAYRTGNPFGFIWPVLTLLFLLFYVIAVRATFKYCRHPTTAPTAVARQTC